MRILLVDNLMIRRYGNLRMGPGRKLMCGAIRDNCRLCEFSDRDMARLLAPLGIRALGGVLANKKLVLCAKNFRPDAVLLGHCDYITNETLFEIRRLLPSVRIAHFNVDPVWQPSTAAQIEDRKASCDALFVTTAGTVLKQWTTGKNVVAYMPNPSDPSMENEDNGLKTSFACDLFFAGNPRATDPRMLIIRKLVADLKGQLRFDVYGMLGAPQIWGAAYENLLATSKMSINLNRKEGDKWYSSDRIAHLMGSGILTFLNDQNRLQDFFTDRQAVFFKDEADLRDKILYYHAHDSERAAIAHAGRERYHALFNGARVLRFMLEAMFGKSYSQPYEWAAEVYR